ncbi:MAG: rod shape-determining protein [Elusimicrobia bacterium CG1_02_63_36]|nr:MAG: rod shape-determining protein [Elusimicrobia bacterium CG1_02_63_36]PIP83539.1 MAG: rod shape-determining protein [Elusimicrobia bacterium CG22_combo_CG10-13_8_21_14_all_63_91]PJA13119.1 MAG: rod shape-determining protein [Elusimicrobia bacterium CG_4_10_14_0_2_um_filter_63_34]PJB26044.1 MAG: rod shape-determining protein [Elusimicrobia bacterium CG_4_9_14_3_um_filter_62_55]
MLDFLFGLFSNDMGIDLGTANTLVSVKDKGIVLREPSVVALDKESKRVLAVGAEAKKMLGRTPDSIVTVRPLKNGVIADFEVTQQMIKYFIRKVHHRSSLLHPRIVISVPSGITEVERRAVQESAEQAGAREVFLIDEAMASAIGAGLPVSEPNASMIVDIGGGATEAAVISLGGMVVSKCIGIAGDEFDEAIQQFLRRKHNIIIGEATSETIKLRIGSVFPLKEEMTMEVKGRDQANGLPKTVIISSEEVRQALKEPVTIIIDMIKDALEETPAELSADLVDRGIIVAGGGALLRGLPDLIRQETELPVQRAEDPLTCVAVGTSRYLEVLDDIDRSGRVVLASKRRSAGGK